MGTQPELMGGGVCEQEGSLGRLTVQYGTAGFQNGILVA